MPLLDRIFDLFGRHWVQEVSEPVLTRGYTTHVIILDGTMSSLMPGSETNAGLTCKMLRSIKGPGLSIYYEAGLQWRDWRSGLDVLTGHGINRQIQRAYGVLASRYRRGDRIYFVGYSRGAYALRSLAGIIDLIGLLRPEEATERNIRDIYRHYRKDPEGATAQAFARSKCHDRVEIECIAVWDTVKALGLRLPFFWFFADRAHGFHNHTLGPSIRAGFHALALNEGRMAYRPVLWATQPGWRGTLKQMWFRGTHGDVGGQLSGNEAARPLANIPLVWLLTEAEDAGMPLPENWQAGFPQDVSAPSIGRFQGWSKMFLARWPRRVGRDRSEEIHGSVKMRGLGRWRVFAK